MQPREKGFSDGKWTRGKAMPHGNNCAARQDRGASMLLRFQVDGHEMMLTAGAEVTYDALPID
jgi:hypothetical protein